MYCKCNCCCYCHSTITFAVAVTVTVTVTLSSYVLLSLQTCRFILIMELFSHGHPSAVGTVRLSLSQSHCTLSLSHCSLVCCRTYRCACSFSSWSHSTVNTGLWWALSLSHCHYHTVTLFPCVLQGLQTCAFVLIMESFNREHRTVMGIVTITLSLSHCHCHTVPLCDAGPTDVRVRSHHGVVQP